MRNKESDIWKNYKITSSGCWEWQKYIGLNGYGQISINNKKISVHRLSYKLHFGHLPDDMHVCHKCDNRKCINPNHLWLGKDLDNLRDMWKKGRGKNQNMNKDKCKNGHLFNGDNLKITNYKNRTQRRICITCEKEYGRKKYLQKIGRDSLPKRTHCKRGHEWIEENIVIRPNGEKNCKICKRINKQEYNKKVRDAIK